MRRSRAAWSVVAVIVCAGAIGIAVGLRTGHGMRSGIRGPAVRSSHFNVLPAALTGRKDSTVVQVDADRAVVFGGVKWNAKSISVADEGS
jgi:hypothetical protein